MNSIPLTFARNFVQSRRNARMTRTQLEAAKLERFRSLVRYVNQHSRYYARVIGEHGIDVDRCLPADFPVLTKQLLMANFDDLVTVRGITRQAIAEFLTRSRDPADLFRGRYRVIHTSGSSGEVGYFVYSPQDWWAGLSGSGGRRRPTTRVRKQRRRGRMRVAYYAAVDGHYAGVTMVSAMSGGLLRWFMDVQRFDVNAPLPYVLQRLNEFQPDVLTGYTTALKILATKQREGRLKLTSVRAITTAGETTTEADVAFLQSVFDCPVTSTYGCSEHLGMGASLPGSTKMVLYDNALIYEFHADHCVITNLFNRTLPLIRYRMSDILRPIPDDQSQSPYPVIAGIVGRNESVPVFRNRDGDEDFISPIAIAETFVAGVTRFQMQLLDAARFRFLICLDPQHASGDGGPVEAVRQRLQALLDQKRMDSVTFEVLVTDDLPVNPRTGKFQLILQPGEH